MKRKVRNLAELLYFKNSMKIMRAGRWELESSRISIAQFLQKDRMIKQRGIWCQFLSVNKTDLGDSSGAQLAANYLLSSSDMNLTSLRFDLRVGEIRTVENNYFWINILETLNELILSWLLSEPGCSLILDASKRFVHWVAVVLWESFLFGWFYEQAQYTL